MTGVAPNVLVHAGHRDALEPGRVGSATSNFCPAARTASLAGVPRHAQPSAIRAIDMRSMTRHFNADITPAPIVSPALGRAIRRASDQLRDCQPCLTVRDCESRPMGP